MEGNWECCIYYYLHSLNLIFGMRFLIGKKKNNWTKIKLLPVSVAKNPKPALFRTLHFGFPSCHFHTWLSSALTSQVPHECSDPSTEIPGKSKHSLLPLSAQKCFPLQGPSLLATCQWCSPNPTSPLATFPPFSFLMLSHKASPPSFLRISNTFCHRISKKNANSL